MQYTYDEILGRMVYTVVDEGTDINGATDVARRFMQLDAVTREYLLARLSMINEESAYKHTLSKEDV